MIKLFLTLSLSLLPALACAAEGGKDPVMNALVKELDRSFSGLKKAEKVPLYYLAYEATVSQTLEIMAELGSISYDASRPAATLDIDMRLNSMELDNTHQVKGDMAWTSRTQGDDMPLAVEADEAALRARIWEYTDKVYKREQERFAKVRMNKAVTAAEDDPSPDFSPAKPEVFYETVPLHKPDLDAWRARLKRHSARFASVDYVYSSNVSLSYKNENRYLVSSEGARIKTGNNYITLAYSLTSRTTDGMDVSRYMRYDGDSFDDLPAEEAVAADMEKSIKELALLKDAPVVEPFNGPAILNAPAAAVYFHEIIGHRLEGHRQKLEDSGQTFAKKVGQKITSDVITLYDDPSLKEFNGKPLRGHYRFDNEGVRSGRASLIEDGVLKGFLMSRSPIRGFGASNGHGRRSPGNQVVSRMGSTIVRASKTLPYAELRRLLLEECKKQNKPFGLVFDDISGGFTYTQRGSGQNFKVKPLLVYKVYADGRPDQVVRGVDIVGTPIASLAKLAAASDDYYVSNGSCVAESGRIPVSMVAPSLLITEMEVEKSDKSQQKPPVLKPPLHDK